MIDITARHFRDHIADVLYHLDFPVAGPGSFPQFMVSALAARHLKVVLGGQGGDEIFGGYARYLLAYFEQCIKAALDGTYKNGNFVVTIESIVPNLGLLREYKPMMREFWRDGLFAGLDERYFRLIDRSTDMIDEVEWRLLDKRTRVRELPRHLQQSRQCPEGSLFRQDDSFRLQVPVAGAAAGRGSHEHGAWPRKPRAAARSSADRISCHCAGRCEVRGRAHEASAETRLWTRTADGRFVERRDKMGFPVPLKEWFSGELQ